MEFKDDNEKALFKKAAAKAALEKVFSEKKGTDKKGEGNEESSDAFDKGREGLVGVILDAINPMTYIKSFISLGVSFIAPYVLIFSGLAMVVVVVVTLLFQILAPIAEASNALNTVLSLISAERTFVNTTISEDDIEERLEGLTLSDEQDAVLRFAYSKVGYPYSQAYRCSGSYYDCSSLAYYAWNAAGVDISYGTGGVPTAAEGARIMEAKGYKVSLLDLKPGDLVYYGGRANGRYMGIYHVAIYVGNGLAIEALNSTYGVVLRNVSITNVIMVIRPR